MAVGYSVGAADRGVIVSYFDVFNVRELWENYGLHIFSLFQVFMFITDNIPRNEQSQFSLNFIQIQFKSFAWEGYINI